MSSALKAMLSSTTDSVSNSDSSSLSVVVEPGCTLVTDDWFDAVGSTSGVAFVQSGLGDVIVVATTVAAGFALFLLPKGLPRFLFWIGGIVGVGGTVCCAGLML